MDDLHRQLAEALRDAAVFLKIGAAYAPDIVVNDQNRTTGEWLKTRGLATTMLRVEESCRAAFAAYEKELAAATQVSVPVALIEQLLEYWNGNKNERAMADALEYILDHLQAMLAAARKEEK